MGYSHVRRTQTIEDELVRSPIGLVSRLANFLVTILFALALSWTYMLNAYGRSADYTIAGYYISWGAYERNYTPRDIDVDKLTHIIYAFANVDKGEVALGDPAVDPRNFAELRQLRAKNARLKILIAVGGWAGSKHFSDVAGAGSGSPTALLFFCAATVSTVSISIGSTQWRATGKTTPAAPKIGKTLPCCCKRSGQRSTRLARRMDRDTFSRLRRADRRNTSPTPNSRRLPRRSTGSV